MTTEQLRERVDIKWTGYGSYKITIKYKGKEYSCHSNNTTAVDDLGEEININRVYYKTDKECLMALYEECKQKNNL